MRRNKPGEFQTWFCLWQPVAVAIPVTRHPLPEGIVYDGIGRMEKRCPNGDHEKKLDSCTGCARMGPSTLIADRG